MLADKHIKECHHLMITCDPRGKLALYQTLRKRYIFVLPEEANDKSLAMTGSYSAMLLAGLLICETGKIKRNLNYVNTLAQYGRNFLNTQTSLFSQLAQTGFERAVFLGSGPLFGVATESHLKLQELTDGKVICKYDSFLGFRHGPKAVIDNRTLVFYLLSNSELVRKYETDLIRSMDKGQKAMIQAGVSEACFNELSLDHFLYFSKEKAFLPDEFLSVAAILPAQMLGFYKSCDLGLSPDSPSASGAISRVVEGVKIYEM
jgi:tagatose-6-phosphate ketose/aldose isomerase